MWGICGKHLRAITARRKKALAEEWVREGAGEAAARPFLRRPDERKTDDGPRRGALEHAPVERLVFSPLVVIPDEG